MTVHFICTGNTYRSRLAEAWCASKGIPGLRVLSSGIRAERNKELLIQPYTAQILREHGLEGFAAPAWRQTTESLIRSGDVLVFMEREHYQFCENWIAPARQITEIWTIADVDFVSAGIMTEVGRTFGIIRDRVDELLSRLVPSGRA